jgi:mono/diheme cytochrome c family protein
MLRRFDRRLATCLLLAALGVPAAALGPESGTGHAQAAPPTSAERGQVKQAESALAKAGNFYRAKKYREAGQAAREAIETLSSLPADDTAAWQSLLAPSVKQLAKARELLADQGVTVPAWPADGKAASGKSVSFVREVAPILVARCGGCHVNRSEGELSMASFAALSKGSAAGAVLLAGDAAGSRMIELIESGDMPRGDGQVSAAERATLKSWIDGGAKFDGGDVAALLVSLVPGAMPQMAAPLKVEMAGDDDKLLFARDIGPILLESCIECHGDINGGNGFSMSSFDRLLQGGGNGPPFVAGKPQDSLIIQKLRGTAAGARMPQDRDALPEATIAKLEKWIELGGKFDGASSSTDLANTVAQSAAGRMTHEELLKERIELAEKTWRLILPDTPSRRAESANVLVVGGVSDELLADVVATADAQVVKLRKLFKVPDDQPLIKGRLTLFVFDKRYDYGEVGTMLERRELPPTWRGHWAYNPLDPYGCILLAENGKAAPGLVAQQIAGVYVASLGSVPRWFAEGSARAIASRLDPKDPRIEIWDRQVASVLDGNRKPENFLAGTMAPEDSDVLSYSFVSKFLMMPATRYVGVIGALQSGASFDQAFAKAYGADPSEVIPSWTIRVNRRSK